VIFGNPSGNCGIATIISCKPKECVEESAAVQESVAFFFFFSFHAASIISC